jgi:hypothetical protein
MGTGVQVPLWVAVVIAVASPLLAFAGVLVGQWLARKSAHESETRWRREETMRMLRWAAEMAAEASVVRSKVGLAALDALDGSELLQDDDQELITAVLRVVITPQVAEYHPGDGTEVV